MEHLHEPLCVGPHAGQLRHHLDFDAAVVAAAQESVLRLLDHCSDVGGVGCDRQRPRLDTRQIQEIVDQVAHLVGLFLDDAEELTSLCGIQRRRGASRRSSRALNRSQRSPQFVAHHSEELGAQPLEFLQRRYVLHGGHDRRDLAVVGADRRGVYEGGHLLAARATHNQLLCLHRLSGTGRPHNREILVGDRGTVHPAEGNLP